MLPRSLIIMAVGGPVTKIDQWAIHLGERPREEIDGFGSAVFDFRGEDINDGGGLP